MTGIRALSGVAMICGGMTYESILSDFTDGILDYLVINAASVLGMLSQEWGWWIMLEDAAGIRRVVLAIFGKGLMDFP